MDHVIKILEIQHIAKDGSILWEAHNLSNMLHITGEEYILKTMFVGGVTIPSAYYFGLDNRNILAASDDWAQITPTEPSTYGYARVPINSTGEFAVAVALTGHNIASSPVVTFSAIGGAYGPVRNMFLVTTADDSGYLIASVALLSSVTLAAGEHLSARMGLGLKDCP
jgi:hypothetical protein